MARPLKAQASLICEWSMLRISTRWLFWPLALSTHGESPSFLPPSLFFSLSSLFPPFLPFLSTSFLPPHHLSYQLVSGICPMASMASGSQEIKLKLATYFFQILFQFKQRIPSFSFQEKRKKFESDTQTCQWSILLRWWKRRTRKRQRRRTWER